MTKHRRRLYRIFSTMDGFPQGAHCRRAGVDQGKSPRVPERRAELDGAHVQQRHAPHLGEKEKLMRCDCFATTTRSRLRDHRARSLEIIYGLGKTCRKATFFACCVGVGSAPGIYGVPKVGTNVKLESGLRLTVPNPAPTNRGTRRV